MTIRDHYQRRRKAFPERCTRSFVGYCLALLFHWAVSTQAVDSLGHLAAADSAPPNEFTIPIQSISELAQRAALQSNGLVRVQGVVQSWIAGRELTVKDSTGVVRVLTQQTNHLKKEMLVDLVGKLMTEGGTPQIVDGRFRRLGLGLPTPDEQLKQLQRPSLGGTPLKVLTRVETVRLLEDKEAALGYPVVIRGVITYYDPVSNDCFVQDASAGIWIDTMSTLEQGFDLQAGDLVQVDGYSGPGFAPSLIRPHFQILGRSQFPNREVSALPQLLTGREDAQWVKVIGMVRSVAKDGAHLALNLEMNNGGKLKAVVEGPIALDRFRDLSGATVQIEGVCATLFNHKRQLIGVELLVPNTNQVLVVSESITDPHALPFRAIRDLLQYQPQSQPDRRVRVTGVVTLVRPDKSFFIHDSSDGLLIERQDGALVKPGDTVEVVGFPSVGEFSPVLQNAVCFRTGTGALPTVHPASIGELMEGKFDSDLIRTEATYLDGATQPEVIVLTMRADQRVFDAYLPKVPGQRLARELRMGALLRLTGVCSVQVDENRQPKSFHLLLRGPEDVEVRRTPSALIFTYAYRVLGGLTLASLTALFWVVLLRNRVRRQTEIIRQKMEQEAALEERYRDLFENANDLVFGIDLSGRWLSLNQAVERVLGASRAEIASKTIYDFMVPGHHGRLRTMIERLQAGKPAGTEELEIANSEGQVFVLEISARVLPKEQHLGRVDCIARNITERKRAEAELRETQNQLLRSSRLAGMAEVATSVLHNVGNVLNSVNVSATLVDERVRKSRSSALNRLVKLLSEHNTDFASFLTVDPRGRNVPEFLSELADRLSSEQAMVLRELASLRKNVEHIKDIVAMQQNYAKISGVVESIEVTELIEDSLRMNAGAFTRHEVNVIRQYIPIGPIHTDKHKVLQILINLVRNAKYACADTSRDDKQVTVRVETDDQRVRILVSDNGIGIPQENLTRIFNHGFTTRKEGHGFGLHSGALAAKELGGSLTAQSGGVGQGATFTLELPRKRPVVPGLAADFAS